MWLIKLGAELGPEALNRALEWPLDYLQAVFFERDRLRAEQKYLSLEEIALSNGLELGRTAHGTPPGKAEYWTTPDGFFKRLEYYRLQAGGQSAPEPDFDSELDREFDAFARMGG